MEEWIICIITLILGMVLFHILKGVCRCKVIEGKKCYYRTPDEEKSGHCTGEIHTYYELEGIAGHTNIRLPDQSDLRTSTDCEHAHTGCLPGGWLTCHRPPHACLSLDEHINIINGAISNGLSHNNAVKYAQYLSPHPNTCEDNPGLCKCADIRFMPNSTHPYEVCIESSTNYTGGDWGKDSNYACDLGQKPIMAEALNNMYESCE